MNHFAFDPLEFSNEQYRAILELLPDPVIVCSNLLIIIYMNEAARELLGAAEQENLTGRSIFDFIPPERYRDTLRHIAKLRNSESPEPQTILKEWVRLDGQRVFVESKAIPMTYKNQPAAILLCKDITEQRRAEQSLIQQSQIFETMMHLSPGGCIIHSEKYILSANDSMLKLCGASRSEELVGKSIYALLHPDDHPIFAEQLREAMVSQLPPDFTMYRTIKGNGEIYMSEVSTVLVKEQNGKPIFLSFFRDMTERIEYEQMLLELSRRYEKLIKLLPEPIVISEREKIVYANHQMIKLLKASHANELIGKSIYDITHPDYHEEVYKTVQQVMQSEKQSPFQERQLICLTGEPVYVEISSIQIFNYNGKRAMLSVIRDITERKRSEEMLLRSEKLSVIGQLAAGVAHEIRNPLTALKGFTQILKRELGSKYYYIDTMMNELERIQYIVNEFMSLSKPQVTVFRRRNVLDLLKSVISLLEAEAIIYNVSIQLLSDGENWMANCDENRIKQVFVNVIKNAIEAMPHGGTVTIQTSCEGEMIRVRIQDEGVGIPEELIRNIGEPFFTTKAEGNGLGLMICHRIMDDHQGHLRIMSQPNRGTTVDIELPLAQ